MLQFFFPDRIRIFFWIFIHVWASSTQTHRFLYQQSLDWPSPLVEFSTISEHFPKPPNVINSWGDITPTVCSCDSLSEPFLTTTSWIARLGCHLHVETEAPRTSPFQVLHDSVSRLFFWESPHKFCCGKHHIGFPFSKKSATGLGRAKSNKPPFFVFFWTNYFLKKFLRPSSDCLKGKFW